MGGGGGAMYMAAALVVALVAVQGKDGDKMGKCILDCSEKAVVCTGECALGGGKTECYKKCGGGDVKCVNKCMESKNLRRRLLPLPIMDSDP